MRVATCTVLVLVLVVSVGCRRQAPPSQPVVAAQPAAPPSSQPVAAPVAPPVVEAVAEIPVYPGAAQVERKQAANKDGYVRIEEVKLHSADAIAPIKAFYSSAITAGGWQVTASKDKPDEAEWKLIKGTAVAEIALDARSAGGVDIKIERKDR
ncbi:MAG: hypothetical protein MUF10_15200 [Thermoanaerobaculaceae bacterium]|jgi:hypothetical protein|nr:hypothetical protein [Thermoanaerobaculaceae bacterium]